MEIRRRRRKLQSERYEDAGETEYALMQELREKHFDVTKNAWIKILFSCRKQTLGGKLVLGKVRKSDELLRHLTQIEAESVRGFDFIIFLDKKCWFEAASEADRIRIMRHELRHMLYNSTWKDSYRLASHDIEDFVAEVELNRDDPAWSKRLAESTLSLYEEEKERE